MILVTVRIILIQNEVKGAGWQDNWKWCNKCQVLSFTGHPDHPGNCASGSFHDHTDSGNYT